MGWKLSSFFFLWNIWFGKSDWKVRMIHFFGGSWRKKHLDSKLLGFFFHEFCWILCTQFISYMEKRGVRMGCVCGNTDPFSMVSFFLVLHQTFFKYATKSQWLPGKQRKTRKWKTNTQKNGKNIPQKICTSPKKAPKLYEVVEILVRLLQTFTLLKLSRNPSREPWRWSFFLLETRFTQGFFIHTHSIHVLVYLPTFTIFDPLKTNQNVGKYTSPMDGMGFFRSHVSWCVTFSPLCRGSITVMWTPGVRDAQLEGASEHWGGCFGNSAPGWWFQIYFFLKFYTWKDDPIWWGSIFFRVETTKIEKLLCLVKGHFFYWGGEMGPVCCRSLRIFCQDFDTRSQDISP